MSSSFPSQLLMYFVTYAVHKILAGSTATTVPDYFASASVEGKKKKKKGVGEEILG